VEQYEKLNDEKMNLEDEVESFNETLGDYIQINSKFKKEHEEKLFAFEATISRKEVARKELEEKVLQQSQDLDNHVH
jgi:hypothetical protein